MNDLFNLDTPLTLLRGTARHVIAYSHFDNFDNIKTFDEYIKALKKQFTTSDRDPIRAMVKFLKRVPEQNETQTAFISRLDAHASDIEAIFESSEWSMREGIC